MPYRHEVIHTDDDGVETIHIHQLSEDDVTKIVSTTALHKAPDGHYYAPSDQINPDPASVERAINYFQTVQI